jgi:hypothetical protein
MSALRASWLSSSNRLHVSRYGLQMGRKKRIAVLAVVQRDGSARREESRLRHAEEKSNADRALQN